MGDPKTVGENAMDMEVVEQVASLTKGESFVALSPSELSLIYQTISELEPAFFRKLHVPTKSLGALCSYAAAVTELLNHDDILYRKAVLL